MMVWSHKQVEQWHLIQRAYLEDAEIVKRDQETDLKRSQIQQEMIQLLNSFLEGTVEIYRFNTIFQHKTHNEWSVFGLRGMSGGLFLNKLVKHITDKKSLTSQLHAALRLPKDVARSHPEDSWDGRKSMQGFIQFLEGLIASQQLLRSQLQPARVPFFLSIWWHLQANERWTIFNFHVRSAFMPDGTALQPLQNPVEEYFEFRSRFLLLANELEVTPWQLEHLCAWHVQRNTRELSLVKQEALCLSNTYIFPVSTLQSEPSNSLPFVPNDGELRTIEGKTMTSQKGKNHSSLRTQILWALAKIGLKVGYQVWIAMDDHDTLWNSEQLGALSIESLPVLGNALTEELVKQMDVVWLQKNNIIAIYEIEQTLKNISADLLRFCYLRTLLPKQDIYLCIVTPRAYSEKVQLELSRPTFRENEWLRNLAIISLEMLVQHQEHILRWASSPSVIQDLVRYLSDLG